MPLKILCRGEYIGCRTLMSGTVDEKGYTYGDEYNYPSKVTVVADTTEVICYKMSKTALRFIDDQLKERLFAYFRS